jgi:hypothetical protein
MLTWRYISRFRSATISHPELVDFVAVLQEQFDTWEDLLIQGKLDDALAERNEANRDFFMRDMKKHLRLLREAISKSLSLAGEEIKDEKPFAPSFGIIALSER